MPYGEVDKLFTALVELLQEENDAKRKAIEESGDGKR